MQHPSPHRSTIATAAVALLLLLTGACADGDDDGATSDDSTVAPEGATEEAEGDGPPTFDVRSVNTDIGTLLADTERRVLYATTEDGDLSSQCTAECTDTWIPYVVDGDATVASTVGPDLVATFERDDGTRQVAISGHPLYRYAGDDEPGETTGQDVGGIWFVVTPGGELVVDGEAPVDTHGDLYR